MATTLLRKGIWPRLTSLSKESKQKCNVAVAYFGTGATKLLPLPRGSTLVVDLSERSVQAGNTCPAEIGKLIKRGVRVYSCNNLHAKVFVFGKRAIVGSNNVSSPSKNRLIEAAVDVTDPAVVRSCVEFVNEHRGARIKKKDVERLTPLWNPKGFGGGGPRPNKDANGQVPMWAVALSQVDWDDDDNREAAKARPLAKKALPNKKAYELGEFLWTGRDLKVSENEVVLQVLTEKDKRVFVYAPARVIRIQQYHIGRSTRMIVFVQDPKIRRIGLKRLAKQLEAPSKDLKKLRNLRRLKNPKLLSELFKIFKTPSEIWEKKS